MLFLDFYSNFSKRIIELTSCLERGMIKTELNPSFLQTVKIDTGRGPEIYNPFSGRLNFFFFGLHKGSNK